MLVVDGRDEATKVAEDSLIRQSLSSSSDNKTLPLNIVDALLLAAIDEGIRLDCVSFFYYGDNLMSTIDDAAGGGSGIEQQQ